ncbi:hypothetical protein CEXT_643631, partial [Caerostris extrusa]
MRGRVQITQKYFMDTIIARQRDPPSSWCPPRSSGRDTPLGFEKVREILHFFKRFEENEE